MRAMCEIKLKLLNYKKKTQTKKETEINGKMKNVLQAFEMLVLSL